MKNLKGENAAEVYWFTHGDPKLFSDPRRRWHFLLFVDKQEKGFPALKHAFHEVAKRHFGKLIHILVDSGAKEG